MQIGQVIRKYRKELNLTQEEVANRLGVTPPAVNKWENGNSCPDIAMLAPLARLLHVSLDTLLSYEEEPSDEEIREIVREADRRFQEQAYEDAFCWVREKIETYPNCKMLIWNLACILDAQRLVKGVAEGDAHDSFILNCYERVLESEDEKVRKCAADSLTGYYIRKGQCEKAQEYLAYYSERDPERKVKQAMIYEKMGRREEAYRTYEEFLYASQTMLSMVFHSIFMLAMEDHNTDKAQKMVDKQRELARLFEMGPYYEASPGLELAVAKQDADAVIDIVKDMLAGADRIMSFTEAELYEHMTFRKTETAVTAVGESIKKSLIGCFEDEETFGFMKGDERLKELLGHEN